MAAKNNPSKHASRRPRRGRLALALALALLAPAAWAGVVPACTNCLPEVGNVVSGAATSNLDLGGVMRPGPTTSDIMTITQTTSSAIINWETFNVDGGFTLNFVQPDANSVTLNRVIGPVSGAITPSIIHGAINSTGTIFILNPTGILFGKSSAVNVGGLVASTLDISNAAFNSGYAMPDPQYVFTPGAAAPIVTQGVINAGSGGTIALLAARIENQSGAAISAPGGSVVFGAANALTLDFYNDGLTTVTLNGNGAAAGAGCAEGMLTSSCLGGIENGGSITAAGGHVEMRTTTENGLSQPIGTALFTEAANGGRIWIGGTVSTPTTATRPGSIYLDAGMGNIDIGGISGQTGFVGANAFGAGLNAGTVDISAYQLFTYLCVGPGGVCGSNDSLGWVDATAQGAGGNGGQINIFLGGDFYHAGLLQSAAFQGNAGQINITAAGTAEIHNWILAESGTGNGGTITLTADTINLYRGQRPWLGGPEILYSQAVLSAYGYNNGGAVTLYPNTLNATDLGDVTPADPEYASMINVRGMNGNGGSIDVFAIRVDIGNTWFANANGYQDGGAINLQASTVTMDGRLDANGGMTSDPTVSFGDGGSILIDAYSVDVSGQLYANGGTAVSPYPGTTLGGKIFVQGDYVTLHDTSVFGARGAQGGGYISTTANYLIRVYGDVDVSSDFWNIGGSEARIVPYAYAGYFYSGAVVADTAIATAVGNGTYVYVRAMSGSYSGTGSGILSIEDGASITQVGSGTGTLRFEASDGVIGSNFTIDANLSGLRMNGRNAGVRLDNFTLATHGGLIDLTGQYITLGSGDINTYGGSFELFTWNSDSYGISVDNTLIRTYDGDIWLNAADASSTGGIWLGNGTRIDSRGGTIDLDASGSYSGIVLDDASIHTVDGDISLDASGSYFGGIHLYNLSAIDSVSGAVTLDATASNFGIRIVGSSVSAGIGGVTLDADGSGIQIYNGSDISSNGGPIVLQADTNTAGIDIDASTVYSYGGAISMYASNSDGGGIDITNGSIVDAGAGAVLLDAASGDNGITIDGSAVHAGTGDLMMYAYATAGIHLFNGATVDTDGGDIRMDADDSRYGVVVDTAAVASNGGDIDMSSSGYNTGGIWLQNGAAIDSGDGAIRLDVVGGNVGIRVNDASSIHADGGDIILDAYYNDGGIQVNDGSTVYSRDGAVRLLAPYGDGGIVIFGSMIHAGSAGITLDANYTNGIRVEYGSTVESTGGGIVLQADRSSYGIYIDASTVQSSGGDIAMHSGYGVGGGIVVQNAAMIDSGGGAILLSVAAGEFGINVDGSTINSATGDLTLDATGNLEGIRIRYDASIASTGGDITLTALGSGGGISVYESQISSGTGGITLEADSDYLYGVFVGDSDILSAGGNIRISGSSAQSLGYGVLIHDNSTISSGGGDIDLAGANANGAGLWIADSSVASAGGSIAMQGTGGSVGGVDLYYSSVDSGGGDIKIDGAVTGNATGVGLAGSILDSGVGDIVIDGATDGFGWGVFVYGTSLDSTDGAIAITGHADTGYGIELRHGDTLAARITSGSGNINLVGDGSLAGVLVNNSSDIASTSGDIGIDGRATTGAGVNLRGTATVDAGSGTVVLRAANDGDSDSIIIDGAVSSTTGVNLRPLDEADAIYLGTSNGFSISSSDLSNIASPLLVIGSNLQAGQIRVLEDVAFDGDLTLQNQGGTAGIHLGGMLDVSGYTLGLFAGGSIGQSGAASIHAKSLIATATGDVLLASAQNDVTGNTLAGSAGGQFRYLDANELAIGNVTGYGFNAGVGGGLASVGASGINAYGNVLVRTLSGNLTMNANVNGVDVDLITAGVLLNPASATIYASGSWRVWASTWVGEDRGGLAGSGTLPNLYNCTYGGSCGVTVGSGNHFIYTQQPTLSILIDDASREYGDTDPAFNYSATGVILGDNLAYVLSGYLSSSATSGSDVGLYAISGSFTSAAGYAIAFSPGNLTITPATLLFTADPLTWYMGVPFPNFTGTISGFKLSDTVSSVFGTGNLWFTYATPMSMPGYYAIYGSGSARNYVFAQATGNSTALHLLPPPQTTVITDSGPETEGPSSAPPGHPRLAMCPVTADVSQDQALAGGDPLGNDWSKVRSRLNLLNCFSDNRNNGCSSF